MHLGFARQKKKLSVCVCSQLEAAEREQSLYHLWRKIRVTIADEKLCMPGKQSSILVQTFVQSVWRR